VGSDLAYGRGYIKRRSSRSFSPPSGRKPRRESEELGRPVPKREQTDEEIIALGKKFAAIAKHQNTHDLKTSGRTKPAAILGAVAAIHQMQRKSSGKLDQRGLGSSRPQRESSPDDSEWESASEDESSTGSSDSGLIYGSAARLPGVFSQPAEPSSDSRYHLGADFDRPLNRKPSLVDPQLFGPINSLRGYVQTPCGFDSVQNTPSNEMPPIPGTTSFDNLPLQHVYPVPTSDPARFDAGRGSVVSIRPDSSSGRPAPVPLQQPKPIVPVPTRVFEARAENNDPYVKRTSSGKVLAGAVATALAGAAAGKALASDSKYDESRRNRDDRRRDEQHEIMPWRVQGEGRPAEKERRRREREQRDLDKPREYAYENRRQNKRDDQYRAEEYLDRRDRPYDKYAEQKRADKYNNIRDRPWDRDEARYRAQDSAYAETHDRYQEQFRGDGGKSDKKGKSVEYYQEAPRYVADDAFQTSSYQTPKRPLTPNVVSVDREPDFSKPINMNLFPTERLSRKDSYERDVRAAQEAHEARYGSSKPINAAVVAAAVTASAVAGRQRRNTGGGDREVDPIQEQVDRQWREQEKSRKAQEEERRSRSNSPDPSVVDQWRWAKSPDREKGQVQSVTIVERAESPKAESKSPYDAPNADVRIDNILRHPVEIKKYQIPADRRLLAWGSGEQPFKSRDPSAERERPLLNLVLPTPTPSPMPEQQTARAEPKPERPVVTQIDTSRTNDEYDDELQDSKTPATPRSVTWGTNSTKHYRVESPVRDDDPWSGPRVVEPAESKPRASRKSGWGAIAAAMAGVGAAAAAATGSSSSEPSSSRSKQKTSISDDRPASPVEEYYGSPPIPGPKPQSAAGKPMPGSFDEDPMFTASVAAGMEGSGFNPNMILEDAKFHKRNSPPRAEEQTSQARDRSSVFGELPERGALENDLPASNSDIYSKLSKKDKRRIEKSAEVDSPTASSVEYSSSSSKLSKKEQKRRDKAAARAAEEATEAESKARAQARIKADAEAAAALKAEAEAEADKKAAAKAKAAAAEAAEVEAKAEAESKARAKARVAVAAGAVAAAAAAATHKSARQLPLTKDDDEDSSSKTKLRKTKKEKAIIVQDDVSQPRDPLPADDSKINESREISSPWGSSPSYRVEEPRIQSPERNGGRFQPPSWSQSSRDQVTVVEDESPKQEEVTTSRREIARAPDSWTTWAKELPDVAVKSSTDPETGTTHVNIGPVAPPAERAVTDTSRDNRTIAKNGGLPFLFNSEPPRTAEPSTGLPWLFNRDPAPSAALPAHIPRSAPQGYARDDSKSSNKDKKDRKEKRSSLRYEYSPHSSPPRKRSDSPKRRSLDGTAAAASTSAILAMVAAQNGHEKSNSNIDQGAAHEYVTANRDAARGDSPKDDFSFIKMTSEPASIEDEAERLRDKDLDRGRRLDNSVGDLAAPSTVASFYISEDSFPVNDVTRETTITNEEDWDAVKKKSRKKKSSRESDVYSSHSRNNSFDTIKSNPFSDTKYLYDDDASALSTRSRRKSSKHDESPSRSDRDIAESSRSRSKKSRRDSVSYDSPASSRPQSVERVSSSKDLANSYSNVRSEQGRRDDDESRNSRRKSSRRDSEKYEDSLSRSEHRDSASSPRKSKHHSGLYEESSSQRDRSAAASEASVSSRRSRRDVYPDSPSRSLSDLGDSEKRSKKEKRRSYPDISSLADLDDNHKRRDETSDRGRDKFRLVDNDASSVVSEPTRSTDKQSNGSKSRRKPDDDDDAKSVASSPGGERREKKSSRSEKELREKRSSGGLGFFDRFKSSMGYAEEKERAASKTEDDKTSKEDKKSFLDNAGTLGAGVGLTGAAFAMASRFTRPHASNTSTTTTTTEEQDDTPEIMFSSRGMDSPLPQRDITDPEIFERQIRPAIDPQFGDLLPLPPSEPSSPITELSDLPPLADSRPETPEQVPQTLQPAAVIEAQAPIPREDLVDPEIVERHIRPAIDPQYGDLLPLPPSKPGSPVSERGDLPLLPDSRPETPEHERQVRRGSFMSHSRKRSANDNTLKLPKTPSQSAVPLQFRLGMRQSPISPGFLRPSPVVSPTATHFDQPPPVSTKTRSRPSSWEATKEFKPLYLLEKTSHDSQHEAGPSTDELPGLPPSEPSEPVSRASPDLSLIDEIDELPLDDHVPPLSLDTSLANEHVPDLESAETTPKAEFASRSFDDALSDILVEQIDTPSDSDVFESAVASPDLPSPAGQEQLKWSSFDEVFPNEITALSQGPYLPSSSPAHNISGSIPREHSSTLHDNAKQNVTRDSADGLSEQQKKDHSTATTLTAGILGAAAGAAVAYATLDAGEESAAEEFFDVVSPPLREDDFVNSWNSLSSSSNIEPRAVEQATPRKLQPLETSHTHPVDGEEKTPVVQTSRELAEEPLQALPVVPEATSIPLPDITLEEEGFLNLKPQDVRLPEVTLDEIDFLDQKAHDILLPEVTADEVEFLDQKAQDILLPEITRDEVNFLDESPEDITLPKVTTDEVDFLNPNPWCILLPEITEDEVRFLNPRAHDILLPEITEDESDFLDPKAHNILLPEITENEYDFLDPKAQDVNLPEITEDEVEFLDPKAQHILLPETTEDEVDFLNPNPWCILLPEITEDESGFLDPKAHDILLPETTEDEVEFLDPKAHDILLPKITEDEIGFLDQKPQDIQLPEVTTKELDFLDQKPRDIYLPTITADEIAFLNQQAHDIYLPEATSDEVDFLNQGPGDIYLPAITTDEVEFLDVQPHNVYLPSALADEVEFLDPKPYDILLPQFTTDEADSLGEAEEEKTQMLAADVTSGTSHDLMPGGRALVDPQDSLDAHAISADPLVSHDGQLREVAEEVQAIEPLRVEHENSSSSMQTPEDLSYLEQHTPDVPPQGGERSNAVETPQAMAEAPVKLSKKELKRRKKLEVAEAAAAAAVVAVSSAAIAMASETREPELPTNSSELPGLPEADEQEARDLAESTVLLEPVQDRDIVIENTLPLEEPLPITESLDRHASPSVKLSKNLEKREETGADAITAVAKSAELQITEPQVDQSLLIALPEADAEENQTLSMPLAEPDATDVLQEKTGMPQPEVAAAATDLFESPSSSPAKLSKKELKRRQKAASEVEAAVVAAQATEDERSLPSMDQSSLQMQSQASSNSSRALGEPAGTPIVNDILEDNAMIAEPQVPLDSITSSEGPVLPAAKLSKKQLKRQKKAEAEAAAAAAVAANTTASAEAPRELSVTDQTALPQLPDVDEQESRDLVQPTEQPDLLMDAPQRARMAENEVSLEIAESTSQPAENVVVDTSPIKPSKKELKRRQKAETEAALALPVARTAESAVERSLITALPDFDDREARDLHGLTEQLTISEEDHTVDVPTATEGPSTTSEHPEQIAAALETPPSPMKLSKTELKRQKQAEAAAVPAAATTFATAIAASDPKSPGERPAEPRLDQLQPPRPEYDGQGPGGADSVGRLSVNNLESHSAIAEDPNPGTEGIAQVKDNIASSPAEASVIAGDVTATVPGDEPSEIVVVDSTTEPTLADESNIGSTTTEPVDAQEQLSRDVIEGTAAAPVKLSKKEKRRLKRLEEDTAAGAAEVSQAAPSSMQPQEDSQEIPEGASARGADAARIAQDRPHDQPSLKSEVERVVEQDAKQSVFLEAPVSEIPSLQTEQLSEAQLPPTSPVLKQEKPQQDSREVQREVEQPQPAIETITEEDPELEALRALLFFKSKKPKQKANRTLSEAEKSSAPAVQLTDEQSAPQPVGLPQADQVPREEVSATVDERVEPEALIVEDDARSAEPTLADQTALKAQALDNDSPKASESGATQSDDPLVATPTEQIVQEGLILNSESFDSDRTHAVTDTVSAVDSLGLPEAAHSSNPDVPGSATREVPVAVDSHKPEPLINDPRSPEAIEEDEELAALTTKKEQRGKLRIKERRRFEELTQKATIRAAELAERRQATMETQPTHDAGAAKLTEAKTPASSQELPAGSQTEQPETILTATEPVLDARIDTSATDKLATAESDHSSTHTQQSSSNDLTTQDDTQVPSSDADAVAGRDLQMEDALIIEQDFASTTTENAVPKRPEDASTNMEAISGSSIGPLAKEPPPVPVANPPAPPEAAADAASQSDVPIKDSAATEMIIEEDPELEALRAKLFSKSKSKRKVKHAPDQPNVTRATTFEQPKGLAGELTKQESVTDVLAPKETIISEPNLPADSEKGEISERTSLVMSEAAVPLYVAEIGETSITPADVAAELPSKVLFAPGELPPAEVTTDPSISGKEQAIEPSERATASDVHRVTNVSQVDTSTEVPQDTPFDKSELETMSFDNSHDVAHSQSLPQEIIENVQGGENPVASFAPVQSTPEISLVEESEESVLKKIRNTKKNSASRDLDAQIDTLPVQLATTTTKAEQERIEAPQPAQDLPSPVIHKDEIATTEAHTEAIRDDPLEIGRDPAIDTAEQPTTLDQLGNVPSAAIIAEEAELAALQAKKDKNGKLKGSSKKRYVELMKKAEERVLARSSMLDFQAALAQETVAEAPIVLEPAAQTVSAEPQHPILADQDPTPAVILSTDLALPGSNTATNNIPGEARSQERQISSPVPDLEQAATVDIPDARSLIVTESLLRSGQGQPFLETSTIEHEPRFKETKTDLIAPISAPEAIGHHAEQVLEHLSVPSEKPIATTKAEGDKSVRKTLNELTTSEFIVDAPASHAFPEKSEQKIDTLDGSHAKPLDDSSDPVDLDSAPGQVAKELQMPADLSASPLVVSHATTQEPGPVKKVVLSTTGFSKNQDEHPPSISELVKLVLNSNEDGMSALAEQEELAALTAKKEKKGKLKRKDRERFEKLTESAKLRADTARHDGESVAPLFQDLDAIGQDNAEAFAIPSLATGIPVQEQTSTADSDAGPHTGSPSYGASTVVAKPPTEELEPAVLETASQPLAESEDTTPHSTTTPLERYEPSSVLDPPIAAEEEAQADVVVKKQDNGKLKSRDQKEIEDLSTTNEQHTSDNTDRGLDQEQHDLSRLAAPADHQAPDDFSTPTSQKMTSGELHQPMEKAIERDSIGQAPDHEAISSPFEDHASEAPQLDVGPTDIQIKDIDRTPITSRPSVTGLTEAERVELEHLSAKMESKGKLKPKDCRRFEGLSSRAGDPPHKREVTIDQKLLDIPKPAIALDKPIEEAASSSQATASKEEVTQGIHSADDQTTSTINPRLPVSGSRTVLGVSETTPQPTELCHAPDVSNAKEAVLTDVTEPQEGLSWTPRNLAVKSASPAPAADDAELQALEAKLASRGKLNSKDRKRLQELQQASIARRPSDHIIDQHEKLQTSEPTQQTPREVERSAPLVTPVPLPTPQEEPGSTSLELREPVVETGPLPPPDQEPSRTAIDLAENTLLPVTESQASGSSSIQPVTAVLPDNSVADKDLTVTETDPELEMLRAKLFSKSKGKSLANKRPEYPPTTEEARQAPDSVPEAKAQESALEPVQVLEETSHLPAAAPETVATDDAPRGSNDRPADTVPGELEVLEAKLAKRGKLKSKDRKRLEELRSNAKHNEDERTVNVTQEVTMEPPAATERPVSNLEGTGEAQPKARDALLRMSDGQAAKEGSADPAQTRAGSQATVANPSNTVRDIPAEVVAETSAVQSNVTSDIQADQEELAALTAKKIRKGKLKNKDRKRLEELVDRLSRQNGVDGVSKDVTDASNQQPLSLVEEHGLAAQLRGVPSPIENDSVAAPSASAPLEHNNPIQRPPSETKLEPTVQDNLPPAEQYRAASPHNSGAVEHLQATVLSQGSPAHEPATPVGESTQIAERVTGLIDVDAPLNQTPGLLGDEEPQPSWSQEPAVTEEEISVQESSSPTPSALPTAEVERTKTKTSERQSPVNASSTAIVVPEHLREEEEEFAALCKKKELKGRLKGKDKRRFEELKSTISQGAGSNATLGVAPIEPLATTAESVPVVKGIGESSDSAHTDKIQHEQIESRSVIDSPDAAPAPVESASSSDMARHQQPTSSYEPGASHSSLPALREPLRDVVDSSPMFESAPGLSLNPNIADEQKLPTVGVPAVNEVIMGSEESETAQAGKTYLPPQKPFDEPTTQLKDRRSLMEPRIETATGPKVNVPHIDAHPDEHRGPQDARFPLHQDKIVSGIAQSSNPTTVLTQVSAWKWTSIESEPKVLSEVKDDDITEHSKSGHPPRKSDSAVDLNNIGKNTTLSSADMQEQSVEQKSPNETELPLCSADLDKQKQQTSGDSAKLRETLLQTTTSEQDNQPLTPTSARRSVFDFLSRKNPLGTVASQAISTPTKDAQSSERSSGDVPALFQKEQAQGEPRTGETRPILDAKPPRQREVPPSPLITPHVDLEPARPTSHIEHERPIEEPSRASKKTRTRTQTLLSVNEGNAIGGGLLQGAPDSMAVSLVREEEGGLLPPLTSEGDDHSMTIKPGNQQSSTTEHVEMVIDESDTIPIPRPVLEVESPMMTPAKDLAAAYLAGEPLEGRRKRGKTQLQPGSHSPEPITPAKDFAATYLESMTSRKDKSTKLVAPKTADTKTDHESKSTPSREVAADLLESRFGAGSRDWEVPKDSPGAPDNVVAAATAGTWGAAAYSAFLSLPGVSKGEKNENELDLTSEKQDGDDATMRAVEDMAPQGSRREQSKRSWVSPQESENGCVEEKEEQESESPVKGNTIQWPNDVRVSEDREMVDEVESPVRGRATTPNTRRIRRAARAERESTRNDRYMGDWDTLDTSEQMEEGEGVRKTDDSSRQVVPSTQAPSLSSRRSTIGRAPTPSLAPVVEEVHEEPVRARKKKQTRDTFNRDSGFATNSQQPSRFGNDDLESERQKDSGFHMRGVHELSAGSKQEAARSDNQEPVVQTPQRDEKRRAQRSITGESAPVLQTPTREREHRHEEVPESSKTSEPVTEVYSTESSNRRSSKSPPKTSKYGELGQLSSPGLGPGSPRSSRILEPHEQRSISDSMGRRGSPRLENTPPAMRRTASNSSLSRLRTPEPLSFRPDSPGGLSVRSLRSTTATPPLRRADRRTSGDLRSMGGQQGAGANTSHSHSHSLSHMDVDNKNVNKGPPHFSAEAGQAAQTASAGTLVGAAAVAAGAIAATASSSTTSNKNSTPVANEGRARSSKDMADIYDGFGEGRMGSPRSPTRPHSMRRRQSMQVIELESRVEALIAENQNLQHQTSQAEQISARSAAIKAERDAEIELLRASLDSLQKEVTRLSQVNDGLQSANSLLAMRHSEKYGHLESQHATVARELQEQRVSKDNYASELQNKDAEIARLRKQLEATKEQVREMQRQILASKPPDAEFLRLKDEDHFDKRCQQLCSHVQQWVLRFSKFSDMRACRLTSEINDEKIIDKLDNTLLDGTDVDDYLGDRVRRRDVFMSMTMNMIWEFVFTRYLFGMDREQRQKLKSVEKLLQEVGPPQAVRQWRAVTLTLLSKRPAFGDQRNQDTEAVVQAILQTLSMILPPPSHLENQIQSQLRRVLRDAVDLSIEMRTQKAEYMMLPPLQPEYDANGDLAETVKFNGALMNERSGDTTTNEELESQGAIVRFVLFPLVVKKGDDNGVGDDEIVVCPAQVLVAKSRSLRGVNPSLLGSDTGMSIGRGATPSVYGRSTVSVNMTDAPQSDV